MTAAAIRQTSSYSESEWRMRVDLAACYRLTAHFGFSNIVWNHITARVPGEEEHFLLNRFGMRFDEVTASSLVKLDMDGNVLEGPQDLNITGFVIHSAIHAARKDIVCVMHTHTPGGLAVAALECGLLPVVQDAMMFYNRISYHDYEGLSTDMEERARLAANLGEHFAMIMRNHGLLTAGKTVAEAFIRMYYLERACRAQVDAMSTGQKLKLPPPQVCEQAAGQYGDFWPGKYEWPALVRLLDAKDPSYKT
ncbi:MAG: class II aldolase/adducin family protein [Gammaproteobacteria bacterium]